MKRSLYRPLAAIAAAGLLSFGAVALAQPGPHGFGPGHGGDITMAIAALKGQLNLNTSQQQMWDSVAAATKSAHQTMRANFETLKSAVDAQLANPQPDLAAIATVADDVQTKNTALRKQVRDQWLALYATFTPDQKTIVRDALQSRIARMKAFHEKMQQKHMQENG